MQFEADQLNDLKALFDELTAQPWFDPADREAFAKYLIDSYPNGSFDAKRHRSAVEASARMFYSRKVA